MADAQALDHFRRGREILLAKRREIDHAISEVDRIVALLSNETWMVSKPLPPSPQAGTIRAAVIEMLKEHPRPWGVAEILDAVKEAGHGTTDASLRSILMKMVKRGEIANPSRGKYQIADAPGYIRSGDATGF
jgi:hypothetical protein